MHFGGLNFLASFFLPIIFQFSGESHYNRAEKGTENYAFFLFQFFNNFRFLIDSFNFFDSKFLKRAGD